MKVLYFDTETTGIDHKIHDVVQLSGLIEIDGKVEEEFDLYCQPFDFNSINENALAVNKTTVENLKKYPTPKEMYSTFISILAKYVDKFDRNDKFTPAGYNIGFDIEFMNSFFKKNGDNYWGSWQNWSGIDVLPIIRYLAYMKAIDPVENYKLETICQCFKIKIDAHNALGDIKATRSLLKELTQYIKIREQISFLQ